MQVGGALANVIALAVLPSAAGHWVSPVSVAPGMVLGRGTVVVGLRSTVVVTSAFEPAVAAGDLPSSLVSHATPAMATAASGISSRYMPVRLRLPARACRA